MSSVVPVPTAPQTRGAAFRYVIGESLGRGGMAEVFAGYVNGLHGFQKPVAIKRLLPELACDAELVDRLIAEAKLLVGMQHGNIVGVLDLARDDTYVFLVMEYVDGPSLRQLLAHSGERRLPLGVATYIAQAAATGLEFAHARPDGAIIHADISPSNLLLTTSGEVRVGDFGIARREGFESGIVEGKWAYMAPEQARGEPLTPASDVFALGVVLYEMITGARPFGVPATLDERRLPVAVVPPRALDPNIPLGLEAICMFALAEDPRDRFARMQQVIDALVDERFANNWRDGASELAQVIRDSHSGDCPTREQTLFTEKPVTLRTRSLIVPPLPADLELSDAHTLIAPQPLRWSEGSTPHFTLVPAPVVPDAREWMDAKPDPTTSDHSPVRAKQGWATPWEEGSPGGKPARLFAAVPPPDPTQAQHRKARRHERVDLRLRYWIVMFACSLLLGMLAAVVKFACTT